VLKGLSATVAWHLYLMAQPAGLPEKMISGTADEFFGSFLDAWTNDPEAMPADVRAAYLQASREAIPSIVADYRASANIDFEHDEVDREAGNQLRMPVTVLQQDWGPELSSGAAAMWRAWAPHLDHRTLSCGHFMAEEGPAEVIKAIRALLAR
jgi:pimeloyl-ACP methyl ester carboxylesterase